MKPLHLLVTACALILGGDLLAWAVQTDRGRIEVEDIRWEGTGGTTMSALLYRPPGVDADNKAPGVLAIHGYINTRETQDGFAIELARRGFVVLAMDQTGHGYSDPPAFANGFGGADGLRHLRSLDFVDVDNIGLEGHSMGGWASLIAAAGAPEDYRSIVIEGSSTGTSGAPDASAEYPRNLAVVFSKYDEFSGFMWGAPVAADVPAGPKLMAAFGTSSPVEPGRVYGSIDEGTARIFHQPPVTHPGDHFSRTAIGHAVDWFQRTLDGGTDLDPLDQVWYWKEFGNLIALVGMVLLIFALGTMLLSWAPFASIAGQPGPSHPAGGAVWWGSAALFVLLPALTLFPFKDFGAALPVTALSGQSITNQVLAWALMNSVISAALLTLSRRRRAFSARTEPQPSVPSSTEGPGRTRGALPGLKPLAVAFLLAFVTIAAAYASLAITAAVFTTDFRIWVFAVKPMSPLHLRMAAGYLPFFVLFFVVYAASLCDLLRWNGSSAGQVAKAVALSTVGFIGLIAWQYTPLLLGGTLADPGEALWSIIAFQFVPIMALAGAMTAYFHQRTGQIWVGAFLSALLVTWIVVASQATHHAF